MIVRFGQRMRQAFFQQGNPPAPVQKGPKSCRPGVRAELLVSELDLNGLIGGFELNFRCHRLVSWACARRLIGFIHKNNQSTNGGLSPTALLRLSLQSSAFAYRPALIRTYPKLSVIFDFPWRPAGGAESSWIKANQSKPR